MSNFTTRPNLDNRDFTQSSGTTLSLYGVTTIDGVGQINIDGSFFSKGVNINTSTGSSQFGFVLTHTINGIELQAPSGFTTSSGGGVGDITGATNIGGGVGVFAQKSNKDFDFKSFIPLSAMTISATSNNIYFGVNIDESRTQNRNTVPNSKLFDDQITLNRSYQLPVTANISGSVVLDLSQGELFILTLTNNVTSFDFSNSIAGKTYTFIFIKNTTNKSFAWATGKFWSFFGNLPTLTDPTTNSTSPALSKDIITAFCDTVGELNVVQTNNMIKN